MSLIYIILVNYNEYKDTIDCVNSLRKIKNYYNCKILIVDNGSTNNSINILKQSLNDCIIIESKKNLGFAGGNNLGIKYAISSNADYILLLNNDTLVETDFLNNMISSFDKDSKIGAVGCKIMYYYDKNKIWYGGGEIDWNRFVGTHFGNKEIDRGQCNIEKEVDFVTGCCILIKREIFEKIGLLDEKYFMYFEDADFCVRINDIGYKIWYNPEAVIYHKVGFSSGGEESPFSIRWSTRNRFIFMNKYKSKVSELSFICSKMFFYITRVIRYFEYSFCGRKDRAKSIISGIKEGRKSI